MAGDPLSWSAAGIRFKAAPKGPWNQGLHPRDAGGKFIQNGDPVQLSPTVGGGRGLVIGARGNLITVRLTSGRVVHVGKGQLRVIAGAGAGGTAAPRRIIGVGQRQRAGPASPPPARPPLLAFTAEERAIDALVAHGATFRNAYAAVFNIKPDELLKLERASIIDVDRIAGRVLDPAQRGLYAEYVYLNWLLKVDEPVRPITQKKAAVRRASTAQLRQAALAGYTAARARSPISVCPYDVAGDPVQRTLAVAFVRAYARLLRPSARTLRRPG